MIFETFILILLVYTIIKIFLTHQNSAKDWPPGPWGMPILGHLLLLGTQPHTKLTQWAKKYGPIIFIRLGSFPTVVLNDPKVIREACSRPSFAGRGQLKHFAEGTKGVGIGMVEGPHNTEQRHFTVRNLKDFGMGRRAIEQLIQEEIHQLLTSIQKKSGEMVQVKRMFSAYVLNAVWIIILGQRFEHDDPQLDYFSELVMKRVLGPDTILAKLTTFLPFLSAWLPEISGHNKGVAALEEVTEYMDKRIKERKLTWVKNQPRDYTDAYMDKVADTEDVNSSFHPSKNVLPHTLRDLFVGSMESTNTSLEWIMNFIARNPQVQTKLQEEIDLIVGHSRLPNLSDRPQMPYSEAVVLEILRIIPVLPWAIFHRTLENVELYDYKIPKGTMVIVNLHAAMNDEGVWDEPRKFWPERFLGENGRMKKIDNFLTFGTGKRYCIGESMARDSLFLYTTSIFQKFTISMPPGVPELVPVFGLTLATPAFQVQFDERK